MIDAELEEDEVKFKADSDYDEYIKEYHCRSKETKSYQCLLISAPMICKQVDSLGQQEMMHFCSQAFPPELFDAAAVEELRMCHEVSSSLHVDALIRDFFRRPDGIRATRALHALIVFFGPGEKEGFCMGEKDHYMPLDDIITIVKNEWREALKRDPECLPVRVKIIFAQCFGHLHPKYDKDDKITKFEVVSLTNKEHPLVYSVKKADGTYYIMQLKKYVEEHLGPEIRRLEAWRRKIEWIEEPQPDSGFIPKFSDGSLETN